MVKQGDIILVEVDPSIGHEQKGTRPCIVLSTEVISSISGMYIVAPISSTKREYPYYQEIESQKMKTHGKVMLDQMKSLDLSARSFEFLEKADKSLVEILLMKARSIFDKD